jgi:ribosome biogenesis protein BRX1
VLFRFVIALTALLDSKLDSKSSLHLLNELADLHSCNNTLYLEARRHEDLYLWLSRSPNGPSAKCHVQNLHTMDELKMTGNCLKGSRGICVFDGKWEEEEWGRLMKEMLGHVSGAKRVACGVTERAKSAERGERAA